MSAWAHLGRGRVSPSARDLLRSLNVAPECLLDMQARGEWGNVPGHVARMNDEHRASDIGGYIGAHKLISPQGIHFALIVTTVSSPDDPPGVRKTFLYLLSEKSPIGG